jgi:uncharacterized protein
MTTKKAGILSPFRRDRKMDFASESGPELLKSKVIQVLMTEGDTPKTSGELPWRTGFGSTIHLLRHQRNDDVLAEMARVYIRDALKKWLPGVELVDLRVSHEESVLHLRIQSHRFQIEVEINN